MNRTEAIEALREALAGSEQLAIAVQVLGLTGVIRRIAPPTEKVVASICPDAVLASGEYELDGEEAQPSDTGRQVECVRIEATFRRAAAAYAVCNSLEVEVRVLTIDEVAGEDDHGDHVERFGQGNGPDVDLTDYEPLPESLEALPVESDDSDDIDEGVAA